MSNFEQAPYEFDLRSGSIYEPHLVITATFRHDPRSHGHVHFDAYERGDIGYLLMRERQQTPEALSGASYQKRLGPSRSFHAMELRRPGASLTDCLLADHIDTLGQGHLARASAEPVVWTLFWSLVLSDPADTMIASLDNAFLAECRAEALHQRDSERA